MTERPDFYFTAFDEGGDSLGMIPWRKAAANMTNGGTTPFVIAMFETMPKADVIVQEEPILVGNSEVGLRPCGQYKRSEMGEFSVKIKDLMTDEEMNPIRDKPADENEPVPFTLADITIDSIDGETIVFNTKPTEDDPNRKQEREFLKFLDYSLKLEKELIDNRVSELKALVSLVCENYGEAFYYLDMLQGYSKLQKEVIKTVRKEIKAEYKTKFKMAEVKLLQSKIN